jgi:outer membrane protein assembly factor BamD
MDPLARSPWQRYVGGERFLLIKVKRFVCFNSVAYKLRFAVIFLLIGGSLPCFSLASRYTGRRANRHRINRSEKVPLADLLSGAQSAELRGDSKAALKLYERICKAYKTSDAASGAYFYRGLWYEKDHQFSMAIKMFLKIMERYPESTWFAQSVEHCFQVAKKLQRGTRPHYFGKIPGFRDFDSAVKNYELVIKYAPYSCYAPQALKEIAELHLRAKHPDLAIDALDRIIDLYPNSLEVAYAYLKIAEIYKNFTKGKEYNQGGAMIARRYYREFITVFPQHSEVNFAQDAIRELEELIVMSNISIGDFYFDARYNERAALMFYHFAINFAPYTVAAQLAQAKITEINGGKRPKATPIDFLFPPYKPQSNDEFVAAATVQDRIMDQKEGRIDPTDEKSVTPFIKSEDILGADES